MDSVFVDDVWVLWGKGAGFDLVGIMVLKIFILFIPKLTPKQKNPREQHPGEYN
jgi:hypothetical protein